jgi:hypothetical protein
MSAQEEIGYMHSDDGMTTSHARARVFLAMSKEEQVRFISERLRHVDTTELANIVRAIFGHPHDKGRPRKETLGYELEL